MSFLCVRVQHVCYGTECAVTLGSPSSSEAVMQRLWLLFIPILLILSWSIVPSVWCSLLPYVCILAPGECVVLNSTLVVVGTSWSPLLPPVLFFLCSVFLFFPLLSSAGLM